jgi:hypothetical protein
MEIEAKHAINCDNCKSAIRLPTKGKKAAGNKESKELEGPLALEAILEDGLGNTKDYQFCDEECLRMYLNGRRKKAKASIELDIVNNSARKLIEEI